MHDKKKIAIAILLSFIVFIVVLLGQMMLQQRDAKSPGATPPAQTEPARDPAPTGPVGSSGTTQPAEPASPAAPAESASPAAPAAPAGATLPGGAGQDAPQKP